MARVARHKSFIVGISGPIGSGKSTVAAEFAKKGFAVWSADAAVGELYRGCGSDTLGGVENLGGAGAKRIGEYFGAGFLDKGGAVRKSRLVRMISTAPLKLRVLESLIHPLVVAHAQRWIDAQRRMGVTRMVLESAVFEPKGLGRFIDVLVYVDAERARCRARVAKRTTSIARSAPTVGRNSSATKRAALARAKPASYFSVLYQQRRVYDTPYVIVNNGTRRALHAAFETVFETISASMVQ